MRNGGLVLVRWFILALPRLWARIHLVVAIFDLSSTSEFRLSCGLAVALPIEGKYRKVRSLCAERERERERHMLLREVSYPTKPHRHLVAYRNMAGTAWKFAVTPEVAESVIPPI